jgi:hypothetical protein
MEANGGMRKITGFMITAEEIPNSTLHEIVVIACDDHGDIFKTSGLYLEEAWEYSRFLVKTYGLPEDSIDCDVHDIPPHITRIK